MTSTMLVRLVPRIKAQSARHEVGDLTFDKKSFGQMARSQKSATNSKMRNLLSSCDNNQLEIEASHGQGPNQSPLSNALIGFNWPMVEV